MFEERIGSEYNRQLDKDRFDGQVSLFLNHLILVRAGRTHTFIEDRGFRHINNANDKTGVTYAFWLIRR